ncbi:MAG: glycosyltransferase [Candidatus Omnitrophica bacterium]|nr:glycosyltransferase [Candidatus Omnitrophota bacterium]
MDLSPVTTAPALVAAYAAAGEGHRRAAEAVAAAAAERRDVTVALRDCLEGAEPWFRRTYTDGYLHLVRRAPAAWGALYQAMDRAGTTGWLRALRRWGNARQERGFADWLIARQPPVVIATHFFPVEVIAALKRRGRLRAKLVCAITDWLPHAFWLCPGVDRYAVAADATRDALMRRGIPSAQIRVTGIPIDHRFAGAPGRAALAARLGLDVSRRTILIGSGGFGLGPVEALVQTLGAVRGPYQLLVVAGRNEALRRALEALRPRLAHPMIVYGFVTNMDELMAVADLLISKSGGLTCAEAMARGLPMLVIAPIPGQETRNSAVLARAGAAVQVRRPADVVPYVERLSSPEGLAPMVAAARRLGRPGAAAAVLETALELAG